MFRLTNFTKVLMSNLMEINENNIFKKNTLLRQAINLTKQKKKCYKQFE